MAETTNNDVEGQSTKDTAINSVKAYYENNRNMISEGGRMRKMSQGQIDSKIRSSQEEEKKELGKISGLPEEVVDLLTPPLDPSAEARGRGAIQQGAGILVALKDFRPLGVIVEKGNENTIIALSDNLRRHPRDAGAETFISLSKRAQVDGYTSPRKGVILIPNKPQPKSS